MRMGGAAPGWLIFPALGFLVAFFVLPLAFVASYSVKAPAIKAGFPEYSEASERNKPDIDRLTALKIDVDNLDKSRKLSKTIRDVRKADTDVATIISLVRDNLATDNETLLQQIGSKSPTVWQDFDRLLVNFTSAHYVDALDAKWTKTDGYSFKSPDERVYQRVLENTLEISFVVSVACVLLGYPLAYWINTLSSSGKAIAISMLLLPFWTSFLVRSYAWIVMMQSNGAINWALRGLGIISEPLTLLHTRLGLYIAMTHVLLPLFVLPLFAVMSSIPKDYQKAARSLGATPWRAFRRTYLPLTLPGVASGTILVFVVALGYYITPALVGGSRDTMISMMIALNVNKLLNWELAGALSMLVLVVTLVLFVIYSRLLNRGSTVAR